MNVYIGFDQNEIVAWNVCAYSIQKYASKPVSIRPVMLSQIPEYNREYGKQSTQFTYSRFLVPFLNDYQGYSVFMDCDMMLRTDIHRIMDEVDRSKSVSVVKHDYTPATDDKFFGNRQEPYPKKNWSSVMVFNNARCKMLTPRYVNEATGAELHQFNWIPESEIGELDPKWNHLIGEYPECPEAYLVHWTLGGPYLNGYEKAEFWEEWLAMYREMTSAKTPSKYIDTLSENRVNES